jgi:hypothetical protein
LVSFTLADGRQVDAAQEHGELRRLELDGGARSGLLGELKRSRLEPFVPDRQAVGVPVKDLDAIASAVEEEEEMAGEKILLGETLADESGEAVEAFSEVDSGCVEENPQGMREA